MRVAGRDIPTLFSAGTLGGLSDGRLLERFSAHREEAAFEALVRRHGPMVWGVCRRILRDYHDAQDAFQATFLVLARKGHSIAHPELVANWLYGVACQTARKARSTRAKRRMREGQVTDVADPEMPSHDHRDELTERLDREFSCLPDRYRIPIVLCELEGKSHREAAEQLGWPVGTVSGRLSRARAVLAKRLSRQGVSLSAGALAVLVAHESASAGMPAKLIDSTVEAASLMAAGRALTAGVVPADVAVLVEGVLKTMVFSRVKLLAAALLAGLVLAGGGIGLAYRVRAADGSSRENASEATNGQERRIELPRPETDKPPNVLARAQDQPSQRMVSYPFTFDADKVYELPSFTVDYRDFHMKGGAVSVIPIETEVGTTGVMVVGDGTFRYTPEAGKEIEGRFRAAMLRFNPDERPAIVALEKGRRVSDRGTWEMSRHLLQSLIRHCWQSNRDGGRIQEVLIPPKGAFAADLYSKEHGDLLISFGAGISTAYNFTDRRTLYEKR
jgi:RNA polymerase sigma factor (sigma-70 family)